MTRIAVYPLLLLPNTEYADSKDRFGFRTIRGENDDFEYVLAHNTMTIAENLQMKRFILWARSIAEHLVLRHIWAPLRELGGLTQSAVIRDLISWFEQSSHPGAARIVSTAARVERQPSSVPVFLGALYGEPDLDALLEQWWADSMVPQLPAEHRHLLGEIFRYDLMTRPVFDMPGLTPVGLPVVDVDGEPYYVRAALTFDFDIPRVLADIAAGVPVNPPIQPTTLSLYYKVGFHGYYGNHEQGIYFVGRDERDLHVPAAAASTDGER